MSITITIDGYAGTGKSTIARELAARLGFELLNTGAMYRAVGYLLLQAGLDVYSEPRDAEGIARFVSQLHFAFPTSEISVNGRSLGAEQIGTEEIGAAASKVATFPEVRQHLQAEQRRLAAGRNIVCEGRDQGTRVFPHADCKFFLTASTAVRAERRRKQLGLPASEQLRIEQQIRERDHQDETRPIDPLQPAPDAIPIDSSDLDINGVLNELLRHVHAIVPKPVPNLEPNTHHDTSA